MLQFGLTDDSGAIIYDCNMCIIQATEMVDNSIEQHAFKNVSNCLNTDIYSFLETSGCQSSNLYLNVAHFFSTSVN
jgi:hypothetical protein